MKRIETFCLFFGDKTGINYEFILAIVLTLISWSFIKVIKICFKNVFSAYEARKGFELYQKINVVFTIINTIIVVMIWARYIDNIITVISFVSAAMTLALRDFVYNFFAGLYIKFKKPFVLEQRIEINDIKGDVVSLNALSFELLEIGNCINSDQSTGRIINVPNSVVLTAPIKNYEKNFKYIWTELTIKTNIDVEIKDVKRKLLEIIKSNEVVKRIPKKMELEIEGISLDYHIYYNKLEPIVYCRVVDKHIEFYMRYLVHPKKVRYVEDDIWTKILKANKEGVIKLYDGN